jgi:hypothetical protein
MDSYLLARPVLVQCDSKGLDFSLWERKVELASHVPYTSDREFFVIWLGHDVVLEVAR